MLKSVPANYQYRKCTRFRRPFFFLWSHRLVECFAFLKNVSGCTFFFQKNCNDFSLTFFFFFFIYHGRSEFYTDLHQYDLWLNYLQNEQHFHHFLFKLVFCLVLISKFKHALLKEDVQPDRRYSCVAGFQIQKADSKGKKHLHVTRLVHRRSVSGAT